jgi:hypothetical protein
LTTDRYLKFPNHRHSFSSESERVSLLAVPPFAGDVKSDKRL